MSAEPHISQPKRRTLVALAAGLYATGLAFLLWRLPVVGNPTSLDGAWSGLLQHDWVHDVRAGVGSVFTYGPTGFLLASDHLYGAEAAFTRYYASIATALIVAVLLTLIVARLPSRSWRLAGGSTALLLAPFSFSDLYLAVTALAVLCIRELGSAGNGGPGARPIPGRTWALVLATLLASALTG